MASRGAYYALSGNDGDIEKQKPKRFYGSQSAMTTITLILIACASFAGLGVIVATYVNMPGSPPPPVDISGLTQSVATLSSQSTLLSQSVASLQSTLSSQNSGLTQSVAALQQTLNSQSSTINSQSNTISSLTSTVQGIQSSLANGPGQISGVESPAENADELHYSTLTGAKIMSIINQPNTFTARTKQSIEKACDAIYNNYGLKNFVAVYGNAFTGEENYYTIGKNQDGSAVGPDNIFRWASMTKIISSMIAAKALDEGLFKIDDPIASYMPEWDCQYLKYIDQASYFPDPGGDSSKDILTATEIPLCLANQTTPKTQITVRMLLNFNAGLYYSFYAIGELQGIENHMAAFKYALQKYGFDPVVASIVGYNYTRSRIDPNVDQNPLYPKTYTGVMDYVRNAPLLYKPGNAITGMQSVYAGELGLFGAFLTQVLRAKTGNPSYNAALYGIDRIFKPLGIDSTAWFGYGDSPKPSGYNPSKLMDITIQRNTNSLLWANYMSGVPTPGLKDVPGIVESYKIAEYGTKNYVPSNTASPFHWPNYKNKVVYCKDVPGDSACAFPNDLVDIPFNATAKYMGFFDGSGIGSFKDYAKLLKLFINKGVYNNQRIIGMAAMRYIQTPQIFPTTTTNLPLSNANSTSPVNGVSKVYAAWVAPGLSACPVSSGNILGFDWSFGACVADSRSGAVKFPLSNSVFGWTGVFGNYFIADIETGVYAVYGTQANRMTARLGNTIRLLSNDLEAAFMSARTDDLAVPYLDGYNFDAKHPSVGLNF